MGYLDSVKRKYVAQLYYRPDSVTFLRLHYDGYQRGEGNDRGYNVVSGKTVNTYHPSAASRKRLVLVANQSISNIKAREDEWDGANEWWYG